MTVHLSGKNPKDYGFATCGRCTRDQLIQYHQLGFATDEDRAAAFKKWDEDAKKADLEKEVNRGPPRFSVPCTGFVRSHSLCRPFASNSARGPTTSRSAVELRTGFAAFVRPRVDRGDQGADCRRFEHRDRWRYECVARSAMRTVIAVPAGESSKSLARGRRAVRRVWPSIGRGPQDARSSPSAAASSATWPGSWPPPTTAGCRC